MQNIWQIIDPKHQKFLISTIHGLLFFMDNMDYHYLGFT